MDANVEGSTIEHGPDEPLRFVCNVCGATSSAMPAQLEREVPSCDGCGSTVRARSVVSAVTSWATGASRVLPDLGRVHRLGLGLSDWGPLAERLANVFDYTNTFFDEDPRLDVTDPPRDWLGSSDFVISSDVFEHVAPPVQRAFDGASALLRPGGLLVLTVPYLAEGSTAEHFPNLHDFTVARLRSGPVLVNRTAAGTLEIFDDLVFHGGPGETLEMRVFALPDVLQALTRAGFIAPSILPEDPEHGVVWQSPHSRTLTATKPRIARVPRWRRWRRREPDRGSGPA